MPSNTVTDVRQRNPEAGFGAKQGKCCISIDSRILLALWEKWSDIW